jgi:hypothetical protein
MKMAKTNQTTEVKTEVLCNVDVNEIKHVLSDYSNTDNEIVDNLISDILEVLEALEETEG